VSPLAPERRIAEAVQEFGGTIVAEVHKGWPMAIIGSVMPEPAGAPCWQVTWEGWRGGVIPLRDGRRLDEHHCMPLAPVLAAAACAAEAFAYHAGDHPMAGKRATGLSLWLPGANWLAGDECEPVLSYLPSRLWLIGLGNLGQAYAWLLACLPYSRRHEVELVLQDHDRIAPSNDSTSILSFIPDVGRRKSRCLSDWLEGRGFTTFLEERRFGEWTRRSPDDPGVALCGVDNALARLALEKAGFDLVVEAGLGAGPNGFRSISMHTFPCTRSAEHIWSRHVGQGELSPESKPAYRALEEKGMDVCGLAQLASRTVGVPFVGLVAAAMVVGELLRRLHGGYGLELASGSVASLDDFETIALPFNPYPGSFVAATHERVENGTIRCH
jgi:hypothetical protein